MTNLFSLRGAVAVVARPVRSLLALLLLLALTFPAARAQAPAWQAAFSGNNNQPTTGTSVARATAVDAAGNVFVTGSFTTQVTFGNTRLVSAGLTDVFVAKWDATAGAWAWAVAGGGTRQDVGYGIAVSGGEVYVTGSVGNSGTLTSTNEAVQFGGTPFFSASNNNSTNSDVFVLRYTDGASAPTFRWAVAGGGTIDDIGYGIAVSGGELYVTGSVTNSGTLNASTDFAVQFGGTPLFSASTTTTANSDVFVLRYTDGTTAPTYRWATAGGGTSDDRGYGIAVSGGEVYVTGSVGNSGTLNASTNEAVQFGGTPLNSASTTGTVRSDVFVLRYTDATSAPTYRWAVAGGGINNDIGNGIAVSGGEVYVTGQVTNSGTLNASTNQAVQFGGTPLFSASTIGTANQDVFVACYTDGASAPTYRWAVAGGGINNDIGNGIAVSGGEVYVTGQVQNGGTPTSTGTAVQFGGTPLFSASTSGTINQDVFVARYTDGASAPTYRWATAGGGTGDDRSQGIAVSGSSVWAATTTGNAVGSFGSLLVPVSAAVAGQLDPATGLWQRAEAPLQGGTSVVRATAVDAAGNVFVTGSFTGQVAFGTSRLVSAGLTDVFVAKWNATASAWAWAVAGGGTSDDRGNGIAVSGGEVYVTGQVTNSGTANASTNQAVQFSGTPLFSASTTTTANLDVFMVRYTDGATAPTYRWAVAGGGNNTDVGNGIAVSGGELYVTGSVGNSGTANASTTWDVQFGGTPLFSASTTTTPNLDVFVVRYTDGATAPTYRWATAGGGRSSDIGYGIAVSGGEVYVTGQVQNSGTLNATTTQAVQFGGTPLNSASNNTTFNNDVFVARYSDGASAPTYRWAVAGGGTAPDVGYGIAVSGGEVYVTGQVQNSGALNASTNQGVQFGGTPLYSASTTGTVNFDVFVLRYSDGASAPTYRWAVAGGGTAPDIGWGIAVSGGEVYVTGSVGNSGTANASTTRDVQFGGTPLFSASTTATNNNDVFVLRYTDGTTAPTYRWAVAGGGTGSDIGYGIAIRGQQVTVAGQVTPAATFGAITLANPAAIATNVLARLTDPDLTPTPMPVQLTAFTATAAGPRAARLTWATASEQNSAYFAIERSPDGQHWQELTQVPAAGHSSAPRPYAHTDEARPTGPTYYRLRQVDADGTVAYSPVRALAGAAGAASPLALFPNPTTGPVTLAGAAPGAVVQVLDALGRLVATATADATGTAALALPAGLAAGVYVVRAGSRALRLVLE